VRCEEGAVALEKYLAVHENPAVAEFDLCGPPQMLKACTRMLADLCVPAYHIPYDES
jgi:Na+-transporting NADH:ubiquinone oxidoreductase subunit NqrF